MTQERILAYTLPTLVAVAVIAFWQWAVVTFEISPFVLPAPTAIVDAAI